jgi:hypothetical protein
MTTLKLPYKQALEVMRRNEFALWMKRDQAEVKGLAARVK